MWRREDDLERMLREAGSAYVAAEYGLDRVRRSRLAPDGFDPAAWRDMGALGWAGALIGEDRGGSGLGLAPVLALADIFGRHLLPEPLAACAVIAATVLAAAEGEPARTATERLVTGERIYSLAFQENLNQTAATPVAANLVEAGGGLRLHGRKIFVPAWSATTDLLVTAQQGDVPVLVHLRHDSPGLLAHPRRMADGSVTAELRFEGVAVAAADVLLSGPPALAATTLALARGALCLSAQLEGLAAALFRRTADFLTTRVQFGQRLIDLQALRHQMVDLHIGIELTGASWRHAEALLAAEGPEAAAAAIAAAKARAGQTALDTSRAALQLHGAMGYTEEADVGFYLNAALRLSSWLGNPSVQRRRSYRAHLAGAAIA